MNILSDTNTTQYINLQWENNDKCTGITNVVRNPTITGACEKLNVASLDVAMHLPDLLPSTMLQDENPLATVRKSGNT